MPLPAGHPPFSSSSKALVFYWLELKFVIFAIFVRNPLALEGQRDGLPKAPFLGPRISITDTDRRLSMVSFTMLSATKSGQENPTKSLGRIFLGHQGARCQDILTPLHGAIRWKHRPTRPKMCKKCQKFVIAAALDSFSNFLFDILFATWVFLGSAAKSPRNVSDFLGCFRALSCNPEKHPVRAFFGDFGPGGLGDSCNMLS